MASGLITSWQVDEETMETVRNFIFSGSKITVDCDCSHEIKRHSFPEWKVITNLDSILIKKQRHHFANKGLYRQSYIFCSSHVWIWELDYKEGWMPKNWCFGTVMLQKTLESQMDCKERKLVNPKGNQPWIFNGKTNVEAPILWLSVSKSWLIGKDADVGKGWRQEEEEATQEEIVGWYHQLNGHEFEQTPGDSGGQRSLVCYGPLGRKESDTT